MRDSTVQCIAATYESDEEALASLEELTAGGFYVEESSYVDADNNAFFVADTMKDATQIIDTYNLNEEVCAISDEINDCVIVQTDLTNSETDKLEKDARVSDVESNYLVYGCTDGAGTADGEDLTQWYLDALNVDQSAQTVTGAGVKVELLDSGVSYVSALENVNRVDLTSNDGETGFADVLFDDNSGHGTAMAGLIAADSPDGSLTGINPNAELYSVKILDEKLQAPISKVIEGIYWGIENQVDIINMSFGTEVDSEALHTAIKAASDAGILLVAAAGNNANKGILYPAAYPEVIAVGATTSDNDLLSGSAIGEELELVAPGNQIVSTGMVDGYTAGSGTSLATAEVTGVASLLLGQPGATADIVRGLLRATAKNIGATDAGLVDYGFAKENYEEYCEAYNNNSIVEETFENSTEPETYDTDGIVNGLWATDTHEWLVNKANESLSLNSTYVTIAAYAARAADDTNRYHLSSHERYNGLHGLGIYTANFYAIWKYANFINKGNSAATAKSNALASLPSGATAAVQELANSGKQFTTANMLDACGQLVESDSAVRNLGYNSSDAKKKYLIVGFGCHMIGDIYAHRTLVPEYAIVNAKNTSVASGSSTDFGSYLGKNDFSDWSGLLAAYNKGKLTFPKLKDYAANEDRFNAKYEDNANFCRERLNATLKCTKEFLSRISSADQNVATVSIIQEQTNVSLIYHDEYTSYF